MRPQNRLLNLSRVLNKPVLLHISFGRRLTFVSNSSTTPNLRPPYKSKAQRRWAAKQRKVAREREAAQGSEQPATTSKTEQPAATDKTEQPAATNKIEQPAATDKIEQHAPKNTAKPALPPKPKHLQSAPTTDKTEQPAATDKIKQVESTVSQKEFVSFLEKHMLTAQKQQPSAAKPELPFRHVEIPPEPKVEYVSGATPTMFQRRPGLGSPGRSATSK